MKTSEKVLLALMVVSMLLIAGCILSLFCTILINVFGGVTYEGF